MNNFGVGYAEYLKYGCDLYGEALILNPSRRDTAVYPMSRTIFKSEKFFAKKCGIIEMLYHPGG